MFFKDTIIAIFYLISIIADTLGIISFFKIYRKRVKITHDEPSFWVFWGNQFTTMWKFIVANKGPRKIVVADAQFLFNDAAGIPYRVRADIASVFISKRDDEANFPLVLDDCESLTCHLDYMDYDYIIDKIKADKVQFAIIDTAGKYYRTKWLKIKRYSFNSGSVDQMMLNDSFVLGKGKPKKVKRKLNPHQLQQLN